MAAASALEKRAIRGHVCVNAFIMSILSPVAGGGVRECLFDASPGAGLWQLSGAGGGMGGPGGGGGEGLRGGGLGGGSGTAAGLSRERERKRETMGYWFEGGEDSQSAGQCVARPSYQLMPVDPVTPDSELEHCDNELSSRCVCQRVVTDR